MTANTQNRPRTSPPPAPHDPDHGHPTTAKTTDHQPHHASRPLTPRSDNEQPRQTRYTAHPSVPFRYLPAALGNAGGVYSRRVVRRPGMSLSPRGSCLSRGGRARGASDSPLAATSPRAPPTARRDKGAPQISRRIPASGGFAHSSSLANHTPKLPAALQVRWSSKIGKISRGVFATDPGFSIRMPGARGPRTWFPNPASTGSCWEPSSDGARARPA